MHLSCLPEFRSRYQPEAPCVCDDEVALCNADFAEAVRRAAGALRAQGVSPADVVAVRLPNTVAFVVALFAAWRLGAVVTPINPALVDAEAGYQIADAAAAVLVTDREIDLGTAVLPILTPAELAGTEPDESGPEPSPHAPALVVYTSGTTGRPKGVVLDHVNVNAMCGMIIDAFELSEADHSLLVLPLFHVNGIVASTLSPLLAGGRMTIAGRFDQRTFFERLERSGATYFSAVPTIYTLLTDLPAEVRPDTSAVRFAVCGAAPAAVEVLAGFEERYGIPIVEGYGLSEGTCASTVNPLRGPRKPGTVGLPLPGQEIRIVDILGQSVPPGQPGEVHIKGPNVMCGYLNRPDATASTLNCGWLRTGDIGRVDEDGYLVLVDRAKDMIIRGGENIYPKEIESVVHALPEVAEAAVVGRASAVYGEEPVLFVSLRSGAALTPAGILEHARANLSKYKLPVQITILDALPKNAVGKLDKSALRRTLPVA